jgi:GntR family transcriptional regulator
MFIRIETASGVPISRQVADQVRGHCAAGTLAPGDRLPSVRQLARELAVNQNTILHVYERLTSEGLLERRQGDGTYVAERLPRGRVEALRELLVGEVDRLCHRAADLGVGLEEMQRLLGEAFGRIGKERGIGEVVAETEAEQQPEKAAQTESGTHAEAKTEAKTDAQTGEQTGAQRRAEQWRNW